MNIDGRFRKGFLGELISSRVKMLDGLSDMRGFDWCSNHIAEPHYYSEHILRVDFSNSRCEKRLFINDSVFEECKFDDSMLWGLNFESCKFIRCSFNGCCLYSSDLGGEFYDCSFNNLCGMGEFFSFGRRSIYKNCNFDSVNLKNMFEQFAIKFEDCRISGIFIGTKGLPAYFHGWRYALKRRLDSVGNILNSDYSPVRFIRCDLSGLKTKNVIFEKDVIFKDCKGMPSELKDFGPVVYV